MHNSLKQTALMFLRSALEKILADRDIKKKDNLQLKKACESALEELKGEETNNQNGSVNGIVLPDAEKVVEADRYFLPFELACRSKSPQIVIASLDCLQKLIAYGHLTGSRADSSNPDRQLIDRIVEAICSAFAGQGTDEPVLLQVIKAILAVVLSQKCEVHEASLLLCVRTCFTIYLASKSPIHQATAKGTLTQIINTVFGRMEQHGAEKDDKTVVKEVVENLMVSVVSEIDFENGVSDSKSRTGASTCGDSDSGTATAPLPAEDSFPNVYQKDAYLVFRALCVLASKEEGDVNDPRNTHLRSKLLALDMLLNVLQGSSDVLRTAHPFLLLIKKNLCLALTKNAVSPIIGVFERSLAIFVELVDKFKVHLKMQVEVFFKEIIISMLESSTCSFEQKFIVLNAIGKILGTPQSIVDIYVNYDCDLTSANLFESLVNAVSRTSRTPISEGAQPAQRERERAMRLLGLECLVQLLQCQVEWYEGSQSSNKEGTETEQGESASSDDITTTSPTLHQYEHTKQKKDLMEQGIILFGRKPKQGLKFLQDHGFVGTDPAEIAEFMMKEDRLDKTVVGDYLGDPDDFNKSVMYAYVDDFDFSEKFFVDALRMFVAKFRLPGEAQKIDRLMEKFASRYCECNPSLGLFASADTAYVLAYSIIMLTTDLHSAQVRNKMTKEQYIKMNRGINNNADLPSELLESIYDEIAANELKMKGGASFLLKSQQNTVGGATDAQRKALADVEMAAMSETARVLMESAWNSDSSFTQASHAQHVKPMFKICWTPCLAAFSVGLQASDDHREWSECIRGFRLGIRAACFLRLELERNAYIQALARFTLLTAKNQMAEMKEKNIEAIKLMLTIGDENGDLLEENWHDVLKCVSQLELAQLIGTGLRSGTGRHEDSSAQQYVLKSTGQLDEKTLSSLQEALGETSSQAVVIAVDRIFHGSNRLSSDGIVSFVKALCAISKEELALSTGPRLFLLGKLVEVAFYNMSRIRLHWSRIWAVMGEHFNAAGCNASEAVSHFSVDALRQLAIKFLERGELPNFRFQKDFLRPFEVIMARNRCAQTRELVVACCAHLVDAHAPRIKSGWQNLFSVWTLAAGDPHADISEAAFGVASRVITQQFAQDFASVLDAFQEALKCLAEFACNANLPDMSMEAIRLIRLCATYVSQNHAKIIDAPWEESWSVSGEQRVWLRGWFPIFFELSCIINRCKLDVRTRSLTVMFEIMKSHGEELRPEWWRDLFNIVFRIFDHAKMDENSSDKREWMMTTCNHALYAVVDVFTQHFDPLAEILLTNIYDQFASCIQQQNEQLARSTVNCLETLIILNGEKFTEEMWQMTIALIRRLFENTLPKSLLSWEKDSFRTPSHQSQGSPQKNGTFSTQNGHSPSVSSSSVSSSDALFSEVIVFCVVQSELVDAVTTVVLGKKRNHDSTAVNNDPNPPSGLFSVISPSLLLQLCDALAESQKLARQFNENNGQRTLLWKAGLRGSSKPNLMRQETHALRAMLEILLRLLGEQRAEGEQEEVGKRVLLVVDEALAGYNDNSGSETRRAAYAPVVCELLRECVRLPTEWLPALGAAFPSRLCDLVESADGETLRSLLAQNLRRFLTLSPVVKGAGTVEVEKKPVSLISTASTIPPSVYVNSTSVDESDDTEWSDFRSEKRVFEGETKF